MASQGNFCTESFYLPPLETGMKLKDGLYEIIGDTVNEGGFGRIYKAYRYERGNRKRIVAIKEFYLGNQEGNSYHSKDTGSIMNSEQKTKLMLKKFKKEAVLLKRLNKQHDHHIPSVFGRVFQDKGRYFYAMTFIDGKTLTEIVQEDGPLGEKIAIPLIVQIGKVLYKAHQNGFVVLISATT